MKLKIRKGATVEVITGEDKGRQGAVLDFDPKTMRVKVQGVRLQSKHKKQEGISKIEGFIAYSNVKLVAAAKKKVVTKKTGSKSKAAKQ